MDSLQINTGEIRLAINNDPERVITFNPLDAMFAERFYKLMNDFKFALESYQEKIRALETVTTVDSDGIPINVNDRIDVIKSACKYMNSQIDAIFGKDTSTKVFGGALVMDAYAQFFEGVLPYIQKARKTKIEKYTNKTYTKRK